MTHLWRGVRNGAYILTCLLAINMAIAVALGNWEALSGSSILLLPPTLLCLYADRRYRALVKPPEETGPTS